jgi:hypothetical protein
MIHTDTRTLSPVSFWELGSINITANTVSFSEAERLCLSTDDWICQDPVGDCPNVN